VNHLIFRLCVFTVAGWVNRRPQELMEYFVEENRVLHEHLGGRRLRLATRAEALG
jgi:hypothetical protein